MSSSGFSQRQLDALRAACDTFAPSLREEHDPHGFWSRSASDLKVAEAIDRLVATLPETDRKNLGRLLDLLGSPLLGFTWGGPPLPLPRLASAQRELVMQRWSRHFAPALRRGFVTLKQLNGMLFYALAEKGHDNRNWRAIGYPGPPDRPAGEAAPRLNVIIPAGDVTLTCDTVVVGSGAGGAVVASELAASGEDVIVVEKGPYVDRASMDGLEGTAMSRMYERSGMLVTRDGALSVLAGSCVGGGTTINWAGAFRIPDYVLQQWAREHDLADLLTADFAASFKAVEATLGVGTDRGADNPQNQALRRGCERLGYPVEDIPRNLRHPVDDEEWKAIGFGSFGDRHGLKRDMLDTYLADAGANGARILASTTVERILIRDGRATGLDGVYVDAGEGMRRVTVRASRVVVAAGAIHTPALLMRSGIDHPHLGRHLHLHPTVAVAARYDEVMDPWYGPMMSVVCNAFARLDGTYGFKLETPPIHPGILGLALPWTSGYQHKRAMMQARHIGAFIVLTRDRDGGSVTTDGEGRPVLEYRLSRYDRQHVLRGIAEAARVHLAAGAREVHLPHHSGPVLMRDEDVESVLAELPRWRWGPNRFPLFSAHQMGTSRMGGVASRAPVAPDGQVRGTAGLYVADASVFPESSGANPMLSVQAIAHYIAQGLKSSGTGTRRQVAHASAS